MASDELDLALLLAHQIKPTLVLDSSSTVIAVNEGTVRLTFPHHCVITGNDGLLLGKGIADLGFALLPGVLPHLCTWERVLRAAFDARRPGCGILQNSNEYSKSNPAPNIHSNSADFWDHEDEHQSVIESNVRVTRNARVNCALHTIVSIEESSVIIIRATVRWYPSGKDGVFLITLSRMSLSEPSGPCPSFKAPKARQIHREIADRRVDACCRNVIQHIEADSPDPNADMEGLVRFASGITSSIVPYILVVTDTDGQAINFSKSWYEFSGQDQSESLGDGWLTVIHAEDAIEMKSAWSGVRQNELLHWTH